MNEHVYADDDEATSEAPRAELVHWMEPRPISFGASALSLAVAGGFAAGLAAALVALSLSHAARRERRMTLPLERKLRRLS